MVAAIVTKNFLSHSKAMSEFFSEKVLVAVIGGTGLYSVDDHLRPETQLEITTPWGKPSSPITIVRTYKGDPVAFLSRHGLDHQFSPTTVPMRANIAALKKLGVEVILAFSSVGSLRQEYAPRDYVIPSQVIDRTKGIRPDSFYGENFVGHVGFGEPFDPALTQILGDLCQSLPVKVHTKKSVQRDPVLVCMEGPAFSTRAESNLYRSWGADVINMSCVPEAKLAKEAEISYQMVCMVTDYDAWREEAEPVTVETVVGNLKANADNAKFVLEAALEPLVARTKSGELGKSLKGTMKYSVSTKPAAQDPKLREALNWLHPGYY